MTGFIGSRVGLRGLLLGVTLLAVGLSLATPYLVEGQSVREAESKESELDARTYTQVQSLRRAAGLTNEDLATMDVAGDQAEAVLGELLSWTRRNRGRLDAAEANERRAAREVREAQRRVSVGPRDEGLLRSMPGKAEALNRARAEHRALRQEGARRAMSAAAPASRRVWEDIYGDGLVLPPGRALSRAAVDGRRDYRLAKEGRPAARDTKGRVLRESAQLQAMRQARSSRLAGVSTAERRVLPVPEELVERFDPTPQETEALLDHVR